MQIWHLTPETPRLPSRPNAGECVTLRIGTYARSPFYQQFHKGFLSRPLHELPVLTKTLVMEHFDELVTDRTVRVRDVEVYLTAPRDDEQFLGRYWVNATLGSTGRRGLFLFGRAEWITILASYARVYAWGGALPGPTRRIKTADLLATSWATCRRRARRWLQPQ